MDWKVKNNRKQYRINKIASISVPTFFLFLLLLVTECESHSANELYYDVR